MTTKTNSNVQKFLEIRNAHDVAAERRYARQEIVFREKGYKANLADDAEFAALDVEARRLYVAAEVLTPYMIRENLVRLGASDIAATGILKSRNGEVLGRLEAHVSDLAGAKYAGVAERLGVETKDAALTVDVEVDGVIVGGIDSDGDFNYDKAPDLRTAIAWKAATDGGRVRLIEGFDPDLEATLMLDTVKTHGSSKWAFFEKFSPRMKKVFVADTTSRFGDGYCGAVPLMWRLATRTLGQEHEGYPFCY